MSARSGQLVIVKLFELLNSFQANRTAKAIEKSWWPEKVQRCSSFSTFFLACKYSLCKSAAKHHGDQLELLPYFTFCRGFPQKESRTQSSFCRGFPPKSRTQTVSHSVHFVADFHLNQGHNFLIQSLISFRISTSQWGRCTYEVMHREGINSWQLKLKRKNARLEKSLQSFF